MNTTIIALAMAGLLVSGNVWAASTGQYNMSLQDKVIIGPKGSLTSPQTTSCPQYPVYPGTCFSRSYHVFPY